MTQFIPEGYRSKTGVIDSLSGEPICVDSRMEPFWRDLVGIMKKHNVHLNVEGGIDWNTCEFLGEYGGMVDVCEIDIYFALNELVGYEIADGEWVKVKA